MKLEREIFNHKYFIDSKIFEVINHEAPLRGFYFNNLRIYAR